MRLQVFGTSKHLPHDEFRRRIRAVYAFRTTVRTAPRVARALKPKTAALVSGQWKMRRNMLMMRVVRCFQSAGADFRNGRHKRA